MEIDGDVVGSIPWEGEIEVGEHRLRLFGDDMLEWESDVDIAPEERTEISIDLTRGESPSWLSWVEWGLIGLGGGMVLTSVPVLAVGYGRFRDSEAMYDEIEAGNFSSRRELDLMWTRYDEMYEEYSSTWSSGWALFGVGAAVAIVGVVLMVLDRVAGVFNGRPQAEIDIFPIEDRADFEEDGEPGFSDVEEDDE